MSGAGRSKKVTIDMLMDSTGLVDKLFVFYLLTETGNGACLSLLILYFFIDCENNKYSSVNFHRMWIPFCRFLDYLQLKIGL